MAHGARSHSLFGASNAHRWMVCTASPSFTENLPDTPGAAALEGTEFHEWLEKVVRSQVDVRDVPIAAMREGILLVLDEIKEYVEAGWTLYTEQQGLIGVDFGGTLDICLLSPCKTKIRIIDAKFGMMYVAAENNPQGLVYAGVSQTWFPTVVDFTFVIVQPRTVTGSPVREWSFGLDELVAFLERALQAIVDAKSAPKFVAGEHCHFCKGAPICAELQRKALAVAGENFQGINVTELSTIELPAPDTIPLDRLAHILAGSDILRDWLKAVENAAYAASRSGQRVPGYKIVEAQARRKWDATITPEAAARTLAGTCGEDPKNFLRHELVGIIEAETFIKSSVRASLRASGLAKKDIDARVRQTIEAVSLELTDRASSGNLTLVPDSDPRPAMSLTKDAFQGVTIEHVPAPVDALIKPPAPPCVTYEVNSAPPIFPGSKFEHELNIDDYI